MMTNHFVSKMDVVTASKGLRGRIACFNREPNHKPYPTNHNANTNSISKPEPGHKPTETPPLKVTLAA